jgi:hypothetical protein
MKFRSDEFMDIDQWEVDEKNKKRKSTRKGEEPIVQVRTEADPVSGDKGDPYCIAVQSEIQLKSSGFILNKTIFPDRPHLLPLIVFITQFVYDYKSLVLMSSIINNRGKPGNIALKPALTELNLGEPITIVDSKMKMKEDQQIEQPSVSNESLQPNRNIRLHRIFRNHSLFTIVRFSKYSVQSNISKQTIHKLCS